MALFGATVNIFLDPDTDTLGDLGYSIVLPPESSVTARWVKEEICKIYADGLAFGDITSDSFRLRAYAKPDNVLDDDVVITADLLKLLLDPVEQGTPPQQLQRNDGTTPAGPAGTSSGFLEDTPAESALETPTAGFEAPLETPTKVESPRSTEAAGALPLRPQIKHAGGATSPVAHSAFSRELARRTARAPEHAAEKLVQLLQQGCLDEAGIGRSSLVWDVPLPGGRRFSDMVARAFAAQLQGLGFTHVEWWSGKEWKDMPGKYCVLHDTMYDTYNMRIRVHWNAAPLVTKPSTNSSGAAGASLPFDRQRTCSLSSMPGDVSVQGLLQQVQQVLGLQQQLVLQGTALLAQAEEGSNRAEVEAVDAERRCLEVDKLSNTADYTEPQTL